MRKRLQYMGFLVIHPLTRLTHAKKALQRIYIAATSPLTLP